MALIEPSTSVAKVILVPFNSSALLELRLHNPTSQLRRIAKIETTPGLSSVNPPDAIPAAGETVLSVAIHPLRLGPAQGTVTVLYADQSPPESHVIAWQATPPPSLPDPAREADQWISWKESGLLISPLTAVTAGGSLLLDLRPPEEFQLAHAAGAFSVDFASLEKSPLLSGRPVILMDRGATVLTVMAHLQLWRTQRRLNITIIEGGLRAWRQAGGRMEGPAVADAALYSFTPAELLASRGRPGWRFAAIGSALSDYQLSGVLSAISLPNEAMVPFPDSITVMLSASGDRYQDIESRLPPDCAPVFYLAGGAAALSEHLRLTDRPLHPQQITLSSFPQDGSASRSIPTNGSGGSCCGGP